MDSTKGRKPIHVAAQYGKKDVIEFLLSKGASVNDIATKNGWTPLHIGIAHGRLELTIFLLNRKANVEAKEKYGWTPLHFAAYYDVQLELAALLVEKEADIDAKTDRDWKYNSRDYKKGSTPLDVANVSGKQELADLLSEKKAQGNSDWSPLHYAAKHGNKQLATFMIEHGANIGAKDKNDKTPLDIANENGKTEVANFLREKQNEGLAQRKRRHHHGDHHHHHSGEQKHLQGEERSVRLELKRDSRGIENDNSAIENNQATSGASKPSSWTNAFAYIVDAVKGVSQFISSPFRPAMDMKHSQPSKAITAQGIDTNSTLLLLDVFVRKITGQKYISTAGQCIPPLEAQGRALNITERLEKAIEQAARDSKISTHQLNIDFVEIQKEITGKIMSGKFNEVSGILNSYIEKACPGKEVGCPGKLSLKKFGKFMTEFNKRLDVALNQPMQQVLNRDSTLKASNVKERQISLEPKSYLSDTSVQGHLTQDRGLRN